MGEGRPRHRMARLDRSRLVDSAESRSQRAAATARRGFRANARFRAIVYARGRQVPIAMNLAERASTARCISVRLDSYRGILEPAPVQTPRIAELPTIPKNPIGSPELRRRLEIARSQTPLMHAEAADN